MFNALAFRLLSRLNNDEQSLISELYEYFKEKYFTPEYGDYANFSIHGNSIVSLPTIVIGFFIGINIAAIIAIFSKRVLGDFVRALISEDCFSPGSAKTLSDLGFFKNSAIRGSLRNGVSLRRVVHCVEEDDYYASLNQKRADFEAEQNQKTTKRSSFRETRFKIDFATAHFYLPEDQKYAAEIKFDKKGTNWLSFAAGLVVSVILMVLVIKLTPELLQMLDNFLSIFSGKSNVLN